MSRLSRRRFIKSSLAAAGAGILINGTKATGNFFGANETIRIGVAGINGRGGAHIGEWAKMPDVKITYLIDPDTRLFKMRAKTKIKDGADEPRMITDVRKALDDKDLDAISIATPNHWHALVTIWACQAGKDVYVEKPCSHFWWEGRQMVRAAETYNRIVQHGANSRSNPAIIEGVRKIREGLIGDVYLARGLCFNRRDTIGRAPVEPVPSGLDYDLWTGPAPKHEFTRNRFRSEEDTSECQSLRQLVL